MAPSFQLRMHSRHTCSPSCNQKVCRSVRTFRSQKPVQRCVFALAAEDDGGSTNSYSNRNSSQLDNLLSGLSELRQKQQQGILDAEDEEEWDEFEEGQEGTDWAWWRAADVGTASTPATAAGDAAATATQGSTTVHLSGRRVETSSKAEGLAAGSTRHSTIQQQQGATGKLPAANAKQQGARQQGTNAAASQRAVRGVGGANAGSAQQQSPTARQRRLRRGTPADAKE